MHIYIYIFIKLGDSMMHKSYPITSKPKRVRKPNIVVLAKPWSSTESKLVYLAHLPWCPRPTFIANFGRSKMAMILEHKFL